MDTTSNSTVSTESVEQAASHSRTVLVLLTASLLLQVITFVLMLSWQAKATAKLEDDLRLMETNNQHTRDRVLRLEERVKK